MPIDTAAYRARFAELQALSEALQQATEQRYGGLNGRVPLFAIGADGKNHFAGSAPGGFKVSIPGVPVAHHHEPMSSGGGRVSAEHEIAQWREVIKQETALQKAAPDAMAWNYHQGHINLAQEEIRKAQLQLGTLPAYKTAMTDAAFRDAFMTKLTQHQDAANFAKIKDLQTAFKSNYGMRSQEFSTRMNALRDAMHAELVANPHAIQLHYEVDQEGLHRRGPHFYHGERFDYVTPYDPVFGSPPASSHHTVATAGVKVTASERIAALHQTARAWQAAHPEAPRERLPGGEEVKPLKAISKSGGVPSRMVIDPFRTAVHPDEIQRTIALYGEHQIGAYLHENGLPGPLGLRRAAEEAGVDIKGIGNNKDAVVSAITSHVTNGHYSADFGAPAKAASSKAPTESPAARARREAFLADHAAHMAKHAAFLAERSDVAKHLTAAEKAARGRTKGTMKATSSKPSAQSIMDLPIHTLSIAEHVAWGQRGDISDRTNPYYLARSYGVEHLRQVLGGTSIRRLRDAAYQVMEHNPETTDRKSLNKMSRQQLLDYIEHQVTHGAKVAPYAAGRASDSPYWTPTTGL